MHRSWLRVAVLVVAALTAGAAVVAARTKTCMSPPCKRDAQGRPVRDGKCCRKPDCSLLRHMEDKMALHALFRDPALRAEARRKVDERNAGGLRRQSECQMNKAAHEELSKMVEARAQEDGVRSARDCPGAADSPGLEVVPRGNKCVMIDSTTKRDVDPGSAHRKYGVCKEVLDGILAHEQVHMDRCGARDECKAWASADEELDGYETEFDGMYDQLQSWLAGCTGVASDADWADAASTAQAAATELGSRL